MSTEHGACGGCQLATTVVSRRGFVSAATLSAVALALSGCGGGGGDGTGTTGPNPPTTTTPNQPTNGRLVVNLSQYPVLANVGAAAKVSNTPPLALARTPDGLVAFSLECTHAGTTVNIGNDFNIVCPNHGARYTSAGVWTGGQVTTSLNRLPVTVDQAGTTATIVTG